MDSKPLENKLKELYKDLHPHLINSMLGDFSKTDEFIIPEKEDLLTPIRTGFKVIFDGINEKIKEIEKINNLLSKRNQEYLETIKRLEEFTYISSHDLRAPVVNAKLLINLLKEKKHDPEIIIKKLDQSINNLDNTLDDLINIIARTKPQHQLTTVHLKNIFHQVWKEASKNYKTEHIKLSCNFLINEVISSKVYIENLFYNLISNSLKYQDPLKKKLQISIKTEENNLDIIIHYSDNGLGLKLPEDKNKLFGLFTRAHDHTQGKGIGMYIVYNNINELGGKIDVTGDLNKGLAFTIRIPKE